MQPWGFVRLRHSSTNLRMASECQIQKPSTAVKEQFTMNGFPNTLKYNSYKLSELVMTLSIICIHATKNVPRNHRNKQISSIHTNGTLTKSVLGETRKYKKVKRETGSVKAVPVKALRPTLDNRCLKRIRDVRNGKRERDRGVAYHSYNDISHPCATENSIVSTERPFIASEDIANLEISATFITELPKTQRKLGR
jgi:hypothetical protein